MRSIIRRTLLLILLSEMALLGRCLVSDWTVCQQGNWFLRSDHLTFQAMDIQEKDDWVAFGAIDDVASPSTSAYIIVKQIDKSDFERVLKLSKSSDFDAVPIAVKAISFTPAADDAASNLQHLTVILTALHGGTDTKGAVLFIEDIRFASNSPMKITILDSQNENSFDFRHIAQNSQIRAQVFYDQRNAKKWFRWFLDSSQNLSYKRLQLKDLRSIVDEDQKSIRIKAASITPTGAGDTDIYLYEAYCFRKGTSSSKHLNLGFERLTDGLSERIDVTSLLTDSPDTIDDQVLIRVPTQNRFKVFVAAHFEKSKVKVVVLNMKTNETPFKVKTSISFTLSASGDWDTIKSLHSLQTNNNYDNKYSILIELDKSSSTGSRRAFIFFRDDKTIDKVSLIHYTSNSSLVMIDPSLEPDQTFTMKASAKQNYCYAQFLPNQLFFRCKNDKTNYACYEDKSEYYQCYSGRHSAYYSSECDIIQITELNDDIYTGGTETNVLDIDELQNDESVTSEPTDPHQFDLASMDSIALKNPCKIEAPSFEESQSWLDLHNPFKPSMKPLDASDDDTCPGRSNTDYDLDSYLTEVISFKINSHNIDPIHYDYETTVSQVDPLYQPLKIRHDNNQLGETLTLTYRHGYASSVDSAEFQSYDTRTATITKGNLPTPTAWTQNGKYYYDAVNRFSKEFMIEGVSSHSDYTSDCMVGISLDNGSTYSDLNHADFSYDPSAFKLTLHRPSSNSSEKYKLHFRIYQTADSSIYTTADFYVDGWLCPTLTLPTALEGNPTFTYTLLQQAEVEIDLSSSFGDYGLCGFTSQLGTITPSTYLSAFSSDFINSQLRKIVIQTNDAAMQGTYVLEYLMTSLHNTESKTATFTVQLSNDCTLKLPSIFLHQTTFEFKVLRGATELIDLNPGSSNGLCDFTTDIAFVSGSPPSFITTKPMPLVSITINLKDSKDEDQTFDLLYSMTSTWAGQSPNKEQQSFQIVIKANLPCTPSPRISSTFSGFVFNLQQQAIVVSLDMITDGDCEFKISLLDSRTGAAADPAIFTLTQPIFEELPSNPKQFTVSKEGSLKIHATSLKQVDIYQLEISAVHSSTLKASQAFTATVAGCIALETNARHQALVMTYETGEGTQVHQTPIPRPDCSNIEIELRVQQAPIPFVTFIDLNRTESNMDLFIATEDPNHAGIYALELVQHDHSSGFESVQPVELTVVHQVRDKAQVAQITSKTLNSTNNTTEQTALNSTEQTEAGQISYDFLDAILAKLLSQGKKPDGRDSVQKPLKAQVYDFTPTGNLTIFFNKPIILPPMEIHNVTQRKLGESHLLKIEDVISIEVDSSFYEAEDEQLYIVDYNLTRLTHYAMDIQIAFKHPDSLAQSLSDPDQLLIKFINSRVFMDSNDFVSLDKDLKLDFIVPPQQTKAEFIQIQELKKSLESSIATFSIVNLILNIFLGFGMKYLWKMVNLLQFVVFMREQQWQIMIPEKANICLKELKSLALFEFIPTKELDEWFQEQIGLSEEDACDDIDEQCIDLEDQEKSTLEELVVFIIAGFVILFLILILLLIRCLILVAPKAHNCYIAFKNKLFYGTFIRYYLLSMLKLQVTFCSGLAIGYLTEPTPTRPEKDASFKVIALAVMTLVWLTPAFLSFVLWRNRDQLSHPEIRSKIGALYENFQVEKSYVGTYSIVFIVRRIAFILVMFILTSYPGIQILATQIISLLYISYIVNMPFYESREQRQIEVINECILLSICYHFTVFNNLVSDHDKRSDLGDSLIGFVILLLGINTLIIFGVNFQALKRYCKRVALIKEHERIMQERHEMQRLANAKQQQQKLMIEAARALAEGDRYAIEENHLHSFNLDEPLTLPTTLPATKPFRFQEEEKQVDSNFLKQIQMRHEQLMKPYQIPSKALKIIDIQQTQLLTNIKKNTRKNLPLKMQQPAIVNKIGIVQYEESKKFSQSTKKLYKSLSSSEIAHQLQVIAEQNQILMSDCFGNPIKKQ